jgi:ABC-type lipoprotein release transport system permease subunit
MRAIEKQRNILDYTLSSFWRRKRRNLALVLVYTSVIFLLASVMFFTDAMKREASLILQDAPEMMVQKLVAGRHDLIPVSFAEEISKIRGVQTVKPRLWGYYFDPTNGANYTLMVNERVHNTPGWIVIGNGVARNLLAKENGTIPFKTYDNSYLFLKIKSIITPASELVSTDLVLLSAEDFRKIFQLSEGVATDLIITIRNKNELPTIATKITQLFPDTRPILRDEILRTYDAVFEWRAGLVMVVLACSVFAFIILAWDKATGMSAEERREIGILKAVGWETSDVLHMKLWEGMIVSLSSFLMGLIFAYAHVFISSAVLFEPVLKGWSVIYPDFRLTPHIDAYLIVTLFFLTVVPYTVTTIVPSWRAATVDPDLIMRM